MLSFSRIRLEDCFRALLVKCFSVFSIGYSHAFMPQPEKSRSRSIPRFHFLSFSLGEDLLALPPRQRRFSISVVLRDFAASIMIFVPNRAFLRIPLPTLCLYEPTDQHGYLHRFVQPASQQMNPVFFPVYSYFDTRPFWRSLFLVSIGFILFGSSFRTSSFRLQNRPFGHRIRIRILRDFPKSTCARKRRNNEKVSAIVKHRTQGEFEWNYYLHDFDIWSSSGPQP